ncbi:transcriptional regulator, putative [Babesia caballi]|uniref:Transcriptional regulator, putative n=1 Tax=Babesia caballi TaxID=5871 RepID=A0AAV4LNE3_BABCB|nr:transcriptional regulator, putative [Babesia caballi]
MADRGRGSHGVLSNLDALHGVPELGLVELRAVGEKRFVQLEVGDVDDGAPQVHAVPEAHEGQRGVVNAHGDEADASHEENVGEVGEPVDLPGDVGGLGEVDAREDEGDDGDADVVEVRQRHDGLGLRQDRADAHDVADGGRGGVDGGHHGEVVNGHVIGVGEDVDDVAAHERGEGEGDAERQNHHLFDVLVEPAHGPEGVGLRFGGGVHRCCGARGSEQCARCGGAFGDDFGRSSCRRRLVP